MSVSATPTNFCERVLEDGTVAGHRTVTHYQELESIEKRDGYIAIISDAGLTDVETRIPISMLKKLLGEWGWGAGC